MSTSTPTGPASGRRVSAVRWPPNDLSASTTRSSSPAPLRSSSITPKPNSTTNSQNNNSQNPNSIKNLVRNFDQPSVVVSAQRPTSPTTSPLANRKARRSSSPRRSLPQQSSALTQVHSSIPEEGPSAHPDLIKSPVQTKMEQFNSKIPSQNQVTSSFSEILSRKARKLLNQIRLVWRRRILPVFAYIIVIHILSPRLAGKLWSVIFKIILKKSLLSKQLEYTQSWSFLGGLVMPLAVIAVITYLLSKTPTITQTITNEENESAVIQNEILPLITLSDDSSNNLTRSWLLSLEQLQKRGGSVGKSDASVSATANSTERSASNPRFAFPQQYDVISTSPITSSALANNENPIQNDKALPEITDLEPAIYERTYSLAAFASASKGKPLPTPTPEPDNQDQNSATAPTPPVRKPLSTVQSWLDNSVLPENLSLYPRRRHPSDASNSETGSRRGSKPSSLLNSFKEVFEKPRKSKTPESKFLVLDNPDQIIREDSPSSESPTTPKGNLIVDNDEQFIATINSNSALYDSQHLGHETRNTSSSTLLTDEELALLFPVPTQKAGLQLTPAGSKKPKQILSSMSGLFTNSDAKSLAYVIMNLNALPTEFPVHSNLSRLHLSGNNLTELPFSTMSLMPSLQFLDISDNRFSNLTRSLTCCKYLKELYARNCGMIGIDEGVLEELTCLEVLDLSGNTTFAFAHNAAHLHTLILSNNRLQTLPPSLGLHRGRELVFLLVGGNPFEKSIKVFTDPIVTNSQSILQRLNKDLAQRQVFIPDDMILNNSFGLGISDLSSPLDDKGSLYDWDDDDLKSIHDAEFDSYLNSYSKPQDFGKLRRRSSLPDASRFEASKQSKFTKRITPARRIDNLLGMHSGRDHQNTDASSMTTYHATTNPSYVYIQRLLSHLRDVYDLLPAFHPSKSASARLVNTRADSRAESINTNASDGPAQPQNDDPDAPGLTDDERERIRKRQSPVRRANIAAEIMTTERTYVNELKTLFSLYVEPLERGIFSKTDMDAMFANLKLILNFHKSHLLPNLEKVCLEDPDQKIGSVFNIAAPYFKMYSMYYNNFDTANEMVVHLEQLSTSGSGQLQSPIRSTFLSKTSISPVSTSQASRRTLAKKFKNIVKIAKSSPSHTQISLQSYLIMPVQRLPRYKMLVEQLLESTPPRHPDRVALAAAVDAIRMCVAECNDKKREMEEHERGMKQLSRIRSVKGKSSGALHRFHAHTAVGARLFVREGGFRVVKYVERSGVVAVGGGGVASVLDGLDFSFAMVSSRDKVYKTSVGGVVEARFATGGVSSAPAPPFTVVGQPLGAGLDALSVYGVQRTAGGDFRFLLFTDLLCWCKPIAGSNSSPLSGGSGSSVGLVSEFELIRAVEIGPNTKVECMTVLTQDGSIPISGGGGSPGGGFFFGGDRSLSTDGSRSSYMSSIAPSRSSLGSAPSSGITLTNSRGSRVGQSASSVWDENQSVLRVSDHYCVVYLRGSQSDVEAWLEVLKELGCDGGDL
ncbi:hypothetical protein HK100_008755 [Physocladia obscura]|uniref:DH domain-containing protein n=1 Tax=Physocladia obscura TaxID=109957 RepID=A0AAD5T3S2_9FUNG|nr:hypothetical protein HK100_008755 [Physocladia obscura]